MNINGVLDRAYDLSEGLELKSVRRVRTPAGQRRFGQPIGSVIVADRRLRNLTIGDSDYDDWDFITGANGVDYYTGYDEEGGNWVATIGDSWDDIAVEAGSEEELFDRLDNLAGGKSGETSGSRGKGPKATGKAPKAADLEWTTRDSTGSTERGKVGPKVTSNVNGHEVWTRKHPRGGFIFGVGNEKLGSIQTLGAARTRAIRAAMDRSPGKRPDTPRTTPKAERGVGPRKYESYDRLASGKPKMPQGKTGHNDKGQATYTLNGRTIVRKPSEEGRFARRWNMRVASLQRTERGKYNDAVRQWERDGKPKPGSDKNAGEPKKPTVPRDLSKVDYDDLVELQKNLNEQMQGLRRSDPKSKRMFRDVERISAELDRRDDESDKKKPNAPKKPTSTGEGVTDPKTVKRSGTTTALNVQVGDIVAPSWAADYPNEVVKVGKVTSTGRITVWYADGARQTYKVNERLHKFSKNASESLTNYSDSQLSSGLRDMRNQVARMRRNKQPVPGHIEAMIEEYVDEIAKRARKRTKDDDLDVEVKKGGRFVASQEGARRYGKPIGQEITAADRERAKRSKKKRPPKPKDKKPRSGVQFAPTKLPRNSLSENPEDYKFTRGEDLRHLVANWTAVPKKIRGEVRKRMLQWAKENDAPERLRNIVHGLGDGDGVREAHEGAAAAFDHGDIKKFLERQRKRRMEVRRAERQARREEQEERRRVERIKELQEEIEELRKQGKK